MVDFARHARRQVADQIQPGAADILDRHIAAQRRIKFVPLEDVAEIADAACCQRLDRAGGDRVDAHLLWTKVHRQIFDAGFQRRFGDAHDIVMRDDLFGAIIAQRQQRAAVGHHRQGALGDGGEAVDADVHGQQEIIQRRIDIAAAQFVLVRKTDGVDEKVDCPPIGLERFEHRVDAGHFRDVAFVQPRDAKRFCQRPNAFFQCFSLIGKGDFTALRGDCFRDAPGEAAVIGDAHDQAALATHQSGHVSPAILMLLSRSLAAFAAAWRGLHSTVPP